MIYGCPECEGIECGAVTAVIEKDDSRDDYVWRDFAWQTGEHADLELNGYHGIGPFRFQGAEYRSALNSLLLGDPGARRRVLLIGARVAVLAELAAALRTIGIGADITRDATDVPAEELREYGAVALRRAIGEQERAAVRGWPRAGRGRGRLCRRPGPRRPAPRRSDRARPGPQSPRAAPPHPPGRRRRRGGHRGHLHLPGPDHRVPPRPAVPHAHAGGLRRDSGGGQTPDRPGRQGREGGVLPRGADLGERAGGGDGPLSGPYGHGGAAPRGNRDVAPHGNGGAAGAARPLGCAP